MKKGISTIIGKDDEITEKRFKFKYVLKSYGFYWIVAIISSREWVSVR
jgi:hypothetical protein